MENQEKTQERNQPRKVLIVDPLLEPLRIRMEDSQFILFEKKEKGDDVMIGYYTKLDLCLLEVVKQKMLTENDTKILPLKEFVQEYRKVFEEFLQKIKLD